VIRGLSVVRHIEHRSEDAKVLQIIEGTIQRNIIAGTCLA